MSPTSQGLGALIREHRQSILSAWEASVRALPIAATLDRPALIDHMPPILDWIARVTDAISSGTAAALPVALAEGHAVERLHEGYGLAQIVRELVILRDCVLGLYEERGATIGEVRATTRAFDEVIATSVAQFTQQRDRTFVALDRIATEAFESRTFDELLQRLLEVFVEACSSVDTASISIRDGDTMRLRASIGTQSRETRALYGVPLISGGEAIGVAHMGSRSELSARDKRLFGVMAARASAALFQQMLKDSADEAAAELAAVARDQRFLARAAIILTSSLDKPLTLAHLAQQAIPEIADWCVVDVLREGMLERVAIAHADPSKASLAREWSERFPPEPRRPTSIDYVLRTGTPVFVREVTDFQLVQSHSTQEYLEMLRELGIRSVIVAPLAARGKTLGAITLVRASGAPYGERELATAVELGRRAGLGLDNARLFAEAQDAVYSRDQMLAIVSHELRSPLASIELGATLVREHANGDPKIGKHLDVVQRSATQMARLISDLLDTASLQVGRFSIEKQREDIGRLVSASVDAHEELARRKLIRIERDTDLAGTFVLGDHDRMLQALGNLLGNALKFCKAGDVIFIKGRREGDQVRLLVEDTGPGIQERDMPYVFDPYWSARRHAAKGTGLGLYICKGIIEAHGGSITVESRPGEGTTFALVLPLDGT